MLVGHGDGRQVLHRFHPEPGHQRQRGHQQERKAKACVVDHEAGAERPQEIRDGRPDRKPGEHLLELRGVLGRAPDMALQRNGRRAGSASGQQGAEAKHRKYRKGDGQARTRGGSHHAQAHGTLEAVPVGIAAGGQCEKHLGQRKQRQQHADGSLAVALPQRQQRRGHAGAGHARMQEDVAGDQTGESGIEAAAHVSASSPSVTGGSNAWACASGRASTTFSARLIWLVRVCAVSSVSEALRTCSRIFSTQVP